MIYIGDVRTACHKINFWIKIVDYTNEQHIKALKLCVFLADNVSVTVAQWNM